jgi:hypothetical protein
LPLIFEGVSTLRPYLEKKPLGGHRAKPSGTPVSKMDVSLYLHDEKLLEKKCSVYYRNGYTTGAGRLLRCIRCYMPLSVYLWFSGSVSGSELSKYVARVKNEDKLLGISSSKVGSDMLETCKDLLAVHDLRNVFG